MKRPALTCAGLSCRVRAHSNGGGLGAVRLVQRVSVNATRGLRRFVVLPLIAVALAAGGFFVFNAPAGDHDVGHALDADLCSLEERQITGSAVYLLDLRKPLGDATAPGRSLRDLARDLAAGVELQVYAVTDDAAAPRRLLDRFCKPYSEAEIVIRAAKDQGQGERDCDELPAQVSQRVRDLASGFCMRRDAAQARIDQLAAKAPRVVANAYLIEALEHTLAAFASQPRPWRLYVFSDMLQHAHWYSHLDLGWTGWSFATFSSRQAERVASLPAAVALPEAQRLRVTVFYPPRRRVTESLRPRYAHQTFWRRYFETHQAEVDFVELPRVPVMEAPRLMVTPREELTRDIAAVLEATEKRRKAAAQRELALANLDFDAPPVARSAPVRAGPASAPAEPPSSRSPATDIASGDSTPAPLRADPAEPSSPAVPAAPDADVAAEPPVPAPQLADTLAPPTTACAIALKPEFEASLAPGGYPGGRRVNYGAAVVHVRYTVDEQGRAVDAAVDANAGAPNVAQGDWANLAADTAAEVRRWRFSLPESNPANCVLTPQTATFTYVERCRGSPVPACRTVRASVAAF